MFHLTSIANLFQALGVPAQPIAEPDGSDLGGLFREALAGSTDEGPELLAEGEPAPEIPERSDTQPSTSETLVGVLDRPAPQPAVATPEATPPEPEATISETVRGTVPVSHTRNAKPESIPIQTPEVTTREAKTEKATVPVSHTRNAKPESIPIQTPEVTTREAKTEKATVPVSHTRNAKPESIPIQTPEVTTREAKTEKATVPVSHTRNAKPESIPIQTPEVTTREAKTEKATVPVSHTRNAKPESIPIQTPEVTTREAKTEKATVPVSHTRNAKPESIPIQTPEVTTREAKTAEGTVPVSPTRNAQPETVQAPEGTTRQAKAEKGTVPVSPTTREVGVDEVEVPEATIREAKTDRIKAPAATSREVTIDEVEVPAATNRTTRVVSAGREADATIGGREAPRQAAEAQVAGREARRGARKTRTVGAARKSEDVGGRQFELPRPEIDWETSRAIRKLQAVLDIPETRLDWGRQQVNDGFPRSRIADRPSRERPADRDNTDATQNREARPAATRQDVVQQAARSTAVRTADTDAGRVAARTSGSAGLAGAAVATPEGLEVEAPAATRETTRVDYRSLIDAIVSRARAVPQNGSIEVRFALKPEELGQVLVRIESHGERVKIHILAATRAAVDALGAGAARLAVQMVQAGFGEPEIDLGYLAADAESFESHRETGGREQSSRQQPDSRGAGAENSETKSVKIASRSASRLDRVA